MSTANEAGIIWEIVVVAKNLLYFEVFHFYNLNNIFLVAGKMELECVEYVESLPQSQAKLGEFLLRNKGTNFQFVQFEK